MIRKAKPQDALYIAPLLIQAMGDLAFKLSHSPNLQLTEQFFISFIEAEGNQYSYENAWVYVEEDKVLGFVISYDGSKLVELREPIINYLHEKGFTQFNPDNETEAGEHYIDTISVSKIAQSKGIGKKLLNHLIINAKENKYSPLVLIVDKQNYKAQKLYKHIGFKYTGDKKFMGDLYEHMILEIA